MRPAKVLVFLFLTFLALGLLSWFFPEEGIPIGPDVRLQFPSARKEWSALLQSRKDTAPSIALPDSQLVVLPDTSRTEPVPDTIPDVLPPAAEESWVLDSIRQDPPSFQYPPGMDSLLYPFFARLEAARSAALPLHVLHFGDSQIEGDRISSYLREKWQARFGGGGPGWFPATLVVDETVSFRQSRSSNWDRITFRDLVDSVPSQRRLGFAMSRDTIRAGEPDTEAWMALRWYDRALPRVRDAHRAGFLYGHASDSFLFSIEGTDTLVSLRIPPSASPAMVSCKADVSRDREVFFRFRIAGSPEFYGFFLEDTSGVVVDNIPVRGSSGLDFSRINTGIWQAAFSQMDVGLVILQFGVNLVPGLTDHFDWYEKRLAQELAFIRSECGEVPVLLVGVTDMAIPEAGGPQSYPNLGRIREAQRRAALEAGCIYWDACEAMGGGGSIADWAQQDPPLARLDYTHFTYLGSRIFGELLYRSFEKEYIRYARKKN